MEKNTLSVSLVIKVVQNVKVNQEIAQSVMMGTFYSIKHARLHAQKDMDKTKGFVQNV